MFHSAWVSPCLWEASPKAKKDMLSCANSSCESWRHASSSLLIELPRARAPSRTPFHSPSSDLSSTSASVTASVNYSPRTSIIQLMTSLASCLLQICTTHPRPPTLPHHHPSLLLLSNKQTSTWRPLSIRIQVYPAPMEPATFSSFLSKSASRSTTTLLQTSPRYK